MLKARGANTLPGLDSVPQLEPIDEAGIGGVQRPCRLPCRLQVDVDEACDGQGDTDCRYDVRNLHLSLQRTE